MIELLQAVVHMKPTIYSAYYYGVPKGLWGVPNGFNGVYFYFLFFVSSMWSHQGGQQDGCIFHNDGLSPLCVGFIGRVAMLLG